jgi:hypothetical protein
MEGEVGKGEFEMKDGQQAWKVTDIMERYFVLLDDEKSFHVLEYFLAVFAGRTGQESIYVELQHDVDVRFIPAIAEAEAEARST